LLLIFFVSQYGKVVSYLYCKAQAVVKTVACDCEKNLAAGTKDSTHSAQLLLKDKSEDPYIKTDLIKVNCFSEHGNSCFVNTVSLLPQGFESSLLHPPAGA